MSWCSSLTPTISHHPSSKALLGAGRVCWVPEQPLSSHLPTAAAACAWLCCAPQARAPGGCGGRRRWQAGTALHNRPSSGFWGMLVWAEMASGVSAHASYAHAVGTSQRAKGELLEEGHLPTSLVPRSVDADLRACLLLRFPCFTPVCPLKSQNVCVSAEEALWPPSTPRTSWEWRPWL